jgi:hypothetical protein
MHHNSVDIIWLTTVHVLCASIFDDDDMNEFISHGACCISKAACLLLINLHFPVNPTAPRFRPEITGIYLKATAAPILSHKGQTDYLRRLRGFEQTKSATTTATRSGRL